MEAALIFLLHPHSSFEAFAAISDSTGAKALGHQNEAKVHQRSTHWFFLNLARRERPMRMAPPPPMQIAPNLTIPTFAVGLTNCKPWGTKQKGG